MVVEHSVLIIPMGASADVNEKIREWSKCDLPNGTRFLSTDNTRKEIDTIETEPSNKK